MKNHYEAYYYHQDIEYRHSGDMRRNMMGCCRRDVEQPAVESNYKILDYEECGDKDAHIKIEVQAVVKHSVC